MTGLAWKRPVPAPGAGLIGRGKLNDKPKFTESETSTSVYVPVGVPDHVKYTVPRLRKLVRSTASSGSALLIASLETVIGVLKLAPSLTERVNRISFGAAGTPLALTPTNSYAT